MKLSFTKNQSPYTVVPEVLVFADSILGSKIVYGSFLIGSEIVMKYLSTLVKSNQKLSVTDLGRFDGYITKTLSTEDCSIVSRENILVAGKPTKFYRVILSSDNIVRTVPGDRAVTYLKVDTAKKDFEEHILPALPVPIKEEWKDDFFSLLKKEKTYIYSESNDFSKPSDESPFISISLDLDSLVKTLLEANTSSDFRDKYKRAPNFKPLLSVINPKDFKLTEWLKFFKNELGLEVDSINKEEDIETLTNMVNVFEVSQDKVLLEKIFNSNILHSIRTDGLAKGLIKTEEKDKYTSGFETILRFLINQNDSYFEGEQLIKSEYISRLIGSYSSLFFNKVFINVKNKNWKPILKFLNKISYSSVPTGLEDFAEICGNAGVSEDSFFKKYIPIYPQAKRVADYTAKQYPTLNGSINSLNWEIIDAGDPRAWVVGLETNCCQHLDSLGAPCVTFMAKNIETSGIFRVFDKKGKTIAQSFFWLKKDNILEDHNILVLDNIEVLGSEIRDSILEAYRDMQEEIKKRPMFKIRNIYVGAGYSDIDTSKFNGIVPSHAKIKIPNDLGYSDAGSKQFYL
jgi:phospholipid N-methyltransferase